MCRVWRWSDGWAEVGGDRLMADSGGVKRWKPATEVEKKARVEQTAGQKGQWSHRGSEWEPTILFGSEQNGAAGRAVTHPCVRQHLQHIHCVFLENPKEQRRTPLSFCQLNTGGTFWILLAVQHLDTHKHVLYKFAYTIIEHCSFPWQLCKYCLSSFILDTVVLVALNYKMGDIQYFYHCQKSPKNRKQNEQEVCLSLKVVGLPCSV